MDLCPVLVVSPQKTSINRNNKNNGLFAKPWGYPCFPV
jgi:hypothetical protein